MGIIRVDACCPEAMNGEMKALSLSPVAKASIYCKLALCKVQLKVVTDSLLNTQVAKPVSKSLEVCTKSLGVCVGEHAQAKEKMRVENNEDLGLGLRLNEDSLGVAYKAGQGDILSHDTPTKPLNCHPITSGAVVLVEGVVETPNTFEGDLGPRVLTTTHNETHPLSLGHIHAEKLKPFRKLELGEREHQTHIRLIPKAELVETYAKDMSPLRATLSQWKGYYIGLIPCSITLEETAHSEYHHDWRGLNEGANPRAHLLCVGLLYDTIDELKSHNFTPHFHHYMLLKLLVCLDGLGSMVYIQKQTMGMDEMLGDHLGVYQIGYKQIIGHGPQIRTVAVDCVRNKGELKDEVTNKKGTEIEMHGGIEYGFWISGSRVEVNFF